MESVLVLFRSADGAFGITGWGLIVVSVWAYMIGRRP